MNRSETPRPGSISPAHRAELEAHRLYRERIEAEAMEAYRSEAYSAATAAALAELDHAKAQRA